MKLNNKNVGGVSYEVSRKAYRGSITINGKRYRTKYYPTKMGTRRVLNRLIRELTSLTTRLL